MIEELKELFFSFKNLLIEPAIRLILFLAVCIQTGIAVWGLYNIWVTETWSSVLVGFELVCDMTLKFIEILICIIIIRTLVVKVKSFLGDRSRRGNPVFMEFGFDNEWLGMGVCYVVISNINDFVALAKLTEQAEYMATTLSYFKEPLLFVQLSRYICFAIGVLCILFGVIVKYFRDRSSTVAAYSKRVKAHHEHRAKVTKWHNVSRGRDKVLLFIYFLFPALLPIFAIVTQIMFLHLDFKDFSASTPTSSDETKDLITSVGDKLMNGTPNLILALGSFCYIVSDWWNRPFVPSKPNHVFLYTFLLLSIQAQLRRFIELMETKENWSLTSDEVRKMYFFICLGFIFIPMISWILFLAFLKHDEEDMATALNADSAGVCGAVKGFFTRFIWKPVKAILNRLLFTPGAWFRRLHTLAIILAVAGGVCTSISQTYQKFNIQFETSATLGSIDADFQKVEAKITDIRNSFVVVAATLNPCLSVDKGINNGKSLNDLIKEQATSKGEDGQSGLMPEDNLILQLYNQPGMESDVKTDCFKNSGKEWSGNTASKCEQIQKLSEDGSSSQISSLNSKLSQDPSGTAVATTCSENDFDGCVAEADNIVPTEYRLVNNKECERNTCSLFIGGLIAAFIMSFVPFGGPAIAKGTQIALRVSQGVKKYGKVFKRVASQVRRNKSKFTSLYSQFKKIVGNANLKVKNNYQFFYFLAPSLLLMLVAIGLGFYKRKRASRAVKATMVSFFAVVGFVNGAFTYLSFVFPSLLSTLIQDPFDGKIAEVSISSEIGMDMIKWGYLMSTVSSGLFLLSALFSIPRRIMGFCGCDKVCKDKGEDGDIDVSYEMGEVHVVHETPKEKPKGKKPKRVMIGNKFHNGFPAWLIAFLITIPVYYIVNQSHTQEYKMLELKISPSDALEEVRTTFGATESLEREFGSVNDMNPDEETLCDIVSSAIKGVINGIKIPLPTGLSKISDLFSLNTQIREDVANLIERVQDAVSLNIGGVNLFSGVNFLNIELPHMPWHILLVMGVPMMVVVSILIAMLLALIQQIGFLRESSIVNNMFFPFLERMIFPASLSSFFIQLALIGLFSFVDGFETPMFTLSMQAGDLVTQGILCSILCVIACVYRIVNEFIPIDDHDAEDVPED